MKLRQNEVHDVFFFMLHKRSNKYFTLARKTTTNVLFSKINFFFWRFKLQSFSVPFTRLYLTEFAVNLVHICANTRNYTLGKTLI